MAREVEVCNLSALVGFEASRIKRLVAVLDTLPENLRAPAGSLSIAVMDDAQLAQIHGDFLDDPTETDVITFDGDPDDGFAGEICVSAERAQKVAKEYGNSADMELCLYIAHGFLHLAGIDDIAPEDAKKMRAAEAEAMKLVRMKIKAPIFKLKGG
jgi:probable rRNA maturation factor